MKYNKGILNKFMNKAVAVALETQAEWDQLMELLEKETDVQWSSGKKPTQGNSWHVYNNKTKVACVDENEMRFGNNSFEKDNYEIVKFKDLIKEEKMSIEDKLKFLAERAADGKEFYIEGLKHSFSSGKLVIMPSGIDGEIEINHLKGSNLKLAPQWEFTEDEKVILRNLPEKFTWLARDGDDDLTFYTEKPYKKNNYWGLKSTEIDYLYSPFKRHLFQSIQWSDEEPCEFRKYL